jgi:hypothetical protein
MKTTVITLFALLFLISTAALADGDVTKGDSPKTKTETAVAEKIIASSTNLIVINLNDPAEMTGLPQDILDQFGEVMAYPKNVQNAAEEECVLVGFTYDDDGYINVQTTRASNEDFTGHVVENIEKIRLRNGSVTIGKQYFAKFSFKKL